MSSFIKTSFFIIDLLFLNTAIIISFVYLPSSAGNIIYLIVYSSLAWLFLALVSNPYAITKNWALSMIIKSQLVFLFIHLCVVLSLVLFFKRSYSFGQVGLIYLIFIPIFFLWKLAVFYVRKIKTGNLVRYYLLIGKNEIADAIRKQYATNQEEQLRFAGQIDYLPGQNIVLAIREFCERHEVHQIFCCAPNVTPNQMTELVNFGFESLIQVKIVVESNRDANRILSLENRQRQSAFEIATIPLDEPRNQFIKRLFDLVFSSLFVLLVLLWLIPVVALLIKLNSRGPVFFVQKRNGLKNSPFGCIKFRTMVVNKEADTKQATKNDSRITSVGKFLRKSSIDELPQFLNVLKGDMSLIGPRPHPIKLNEEFSIHIKNIMARHYVKPGITGLAQCMGYRGETKDLADMENRVRLDHYYIEHWTFWLDIKIVFLTVISLLRGSEKAY